MALCVLVPAVAPAFAQERGRALSPPTTTAPITAVPAAPVINAPDTDTASDLERTPGFVSAVQTRPAGEASWLSMRCRGDRPRLPWMHCTFVRSSIEPPEQLEGLDPDLATPGRDVDLEPIRRGCAEHPDVSPLCRCAERACVRSELRRLVEAPMRACRVSHVSFSLELARTAHTTW